MRDNAEASRFIQALTGSSSSLVTFQSFYDPKNYQKSDKVTAATWTSTLSESLQFIDYKQSQYCGIYICINGTDGKGREIENIVDLRCFFVDFDGMYEPEWAIPPHIIQKRDETHGHALWLIDGSNTSHEEWTVIQKQLSMFYGSDPQVIDPARVIRLPGSWHFKDVYHPTSYIITENNTGNGHKYQVSDIIDAHALSAEKDAELNDWIKAREENATGAGYDNDPHEIKRFIGFISNAAHPAVLGSGTLELFRVACYGHDHGIDFNTAKSLLWEHYNPRCAPPWGEHEHDHFDSVIYRAYKYPTSVAGCKSHAKQWQALPALPTPSCGWDAMKDTVHEPVAIELDDVDTIELPTEYDRGYRLSKQQAVILSGQLTAKSSHYDFAQVYDGIRFDGVNLIRCEKRLFRFGGKSWKNIHEDVIRSDIQRVFRNYKPADKFTSGIKNVFMDMINVESVKNGEWLSGSERDTKNLAVFKNGIVDLGVEPMKLMPHTHEFFVLNELSYDFEPNAKCPEWHKFLESIWSGNTALKNQLQEFMGYCLTADNSLQKFAIFIGKSRGGKGVITDIMREMVGKENTCAPNLHGFVKDSTLKEMSTKSLALVPEAHNLPNNVRDAVLSNFKAITGGDSLSFHELYVGSVNSEFTVKIVMSCNQMPTFIDSTGALMNRSLVFPFTKSFFGKEDTELRHKLLAEISGITQWAIEGLRRLRANNGRFTEATDGVTLKEEMRKDMFPLSGYIEDCVTMDVNGFSTLDDLYQSYRIWTSSEGIKTPLSKVVFNQMLRNSALEIIGQNDGYYGMTVKTMMLANNVKQFA